MATRESAQTPAPQGVEVVPPGSSWRHDIQKDCVIVVDEVRNTWEGHVICWSSLAGPLPTNGTMRMQPFLRQFTRIRNTSIPRIPTP